MWLSRERLCNSSQISRTGCGRHTEQSIIQSLLTDGTLVESTHQQSDGGGVEPQWRFVKFTIPNRKQAELQ